jgi:hypothetical protein
MAYNPKSDINEIAYWKREYNNSKRKNDAEGMKFAQESANPYYDNLQKNGYNDEYNYLKGADERSAFDYSKSYGINKDKANAYFDSYVDSYKKKVDTAQEGAINAANAQFEAGKLNAENIYKDAAKMYYNQYLKEKKALPQQLAALGITGGAAESSLIELGNNYLSNLNKAQMQKNQTLAELEAQKAGVLADANMNKANAENDIARLAYEKILGDRDFDMSQRQYLDNAWFNTKSYDDSREDVKYDRTWNEKVYGDSRDDVIYQRGITERTYTDQQLQKVYEQAMSDASMGNFNTLAQLWGVTPQEAYNRYMQFIKDAKAAQNFKKGSVKGTGPSDEDGANDNEWRI